MNMPDICTSKVDRPFTSVCDQPTLDALAGCSLSMTCEASARCSINRIDSTLCWSIKVFITSGSRTSSMSISVG